MLQEQIVSSAPQVVGSFSPLEEFDAPVYNPSLTFYHCILKNDREIRFVQLRQMGRSPDQSRGSAVAAVQAQVKRRRRAVLNCPDVRAERAHRLIQMGELSAARQALEGDPPAPGNNATLQLWCDPERRPAELRGPLAPDLVGHQTASSILRKTGC